MLAGNQLITPAAAGRFNLAGFGKSGLTSGRRLDNFRQVI